MNLRVFSFKSNKAIKIVIAIFIVAVLVGTYFLLRQYYLQKSWQSARDYYKKADYRAVANTIGRQKMPADKEDLVIYAQSMMAVKDYDKSYNAYKALADADQNNFDAKLMMANILLAKDDRRGAEKAYLDIIDKNPNYIQAYLNLSAIYRTQNQKDLANETLIKGLKYNSSTFGLLEYLIEINSDQKDSEQYKQWVKQATELNPGYDPEKETQKQ